MIRYRPFLNCDPPELARIWCSQAPSRGLTQPITAATLDDFVLSKPFFDPRGLVIAIIDGRPVGFVHAGFGTNQERVDIDPRRGVICTLMVVPDAPLVEVATGLVTQAESYLRARGAVTITGGASGDDAPFLWGLYGGSQLPGVLASDLPQVAAYEAAGYRREHHCTVFERDLAAYRAPVDRDFMRVRRECLMRSRVATGGSTRWDACHPRLAETLHFELLNKFDSSVLECVRFWDMEPLASSWRRHAMGLLSIESPGGGPDSSRLVFLCSEAVRELGKRGVSLVEIQVRDDQPPLAEVSRRLSFERVDEGLLFRRPDY